MDWLPLSVREGKQTRVAFDSDGKIIIATKQNCDPILERNKAIRDSGMVDRKRGFRFVASVPNTVLHQWMQEGIDVWSGECQDGVARKLNDPDNFFLRTSEGRIGHVGNGVYI